VELDGKDRVESKTVIWAAGVRAQSITETLAAKLDRAGRVEVEQDCSIPGRPEAFAIGDIASFKNAEGRVLPGVSPVAMQEGRSVARNIVRTIEGKAREPFEYFDKGSMATIGRSRAIAEVGKIRWSGFLAWVAWLVVHIWYLIGFRNRVLVLASWAW